MTWGGGTNLLGLELIIQKVDGQTEPHADNCSRLWQWVERRVRPPAGGSGGGSTVENMETVQEPKKNHRTDMTKVASLMQAATRHGRAGWEGGANEAICRKEFLAFLQTEERAQSPTAKKMNTNGSRCTGAGSEQELRYEMQKKCQP